MIENKPKFSWKDFQNHIQNNRRNLLDKKLFSDVTLVPDDLIPITANKTVLSSASPVSGNYFCLINIILDHFFN